MNINQCAKYTIWKTAESCLSIFTIDAAAFLGAGFSFLKALTIVFLALRFGAFTAPLNMHFLMMLNRIDILAVQTLTISPAYTTLSETLAILRLTSRFCAFTFDLTLHFCFFAVQGEQVVDLALSWIKGKVQKVMELRKSSLYVWEFWKTE